MNDIGMVLLAIEVGCTVISVSLWLLFMFTPLKDILDVDKDDRDK